MPKLYEYLGLSIYFYAGEHLPVHVHGRYRSEETKAEIITANGRVVEVRFRRVANRRPLSLEVPARTLLNLSGPKQKRFCRNGPTFSF